MSTLPNHVPWLQWYSLPECLELNPLKRRAKINSTLMLFSWAFSHSDQYSTRGQENVEASIFARRLNYLELARVYEVGQEREREGGERKLGHPSGLIYWSIKYVKDMVGDEVERFSRTSPWAFRLWWRVQSCPPKPMGGATTGPHTGNKSREID